jgi:hypothetical protein
MSTSIRLLLAVLVLGCAGAPPSHDPSPGDGGSGGDEEPGGSGGATTGGSGGSKPSDLTGGTGASSTAGAGGSDRAGAGGSSGGAAGEATADAGAGSGGSDDAGPPLSGEAPYGCTGCKRLFDGKTLAGWDTVAGAWVVKEGGILASTGVAADLYTHADLGDYRVFFQIRHLPAMGGKDHQPCVVLFGKRPADPTKPARSLGGAQFQPPNGYSWDYGIGGKFTSPAGKPKLDASQWNQCEIVVKAAGSFRAACCAYAADKPCKTFEVLSWMGPGRKHPLDLMMHNGGLFDEYRELWIEENPTVDGYLSQK